MKKVLFKKNPSYFLIMALVGLAAVLIGFAKTFIIPVATNSFKAPLLIHVHGAFAFAWILLFLTQTLLIHFNKYNIHQALGILGILIAAGVTMTIIPVGYFVVQRDLNQGLGESAYSNLVGIFTSGIMFFCLVLAGVIKGKVPATHKRLMLLATIVVLWPAWFRFRHYFPAVPNPEIWFALVLADSLIIISWIWDRMKYGKINPVLKYVGLFIILEQTFEVIAYDSTAWRQTAKWIYNFLNLSLVQVL